ncbi:hypothetical protein FKM82_023082 [Ascaphus truei]
MPARSMIPNITNERPSRIVTLIQTDVPMCCRRREGKKRLYSTIREFQKVRRQKPKHKIYYNLAAVRTRIEYSIYRDFITHQKQDSKVLDLADQKMLEES